MTDLEVILASHAAGEPRGDLPAGDQPQLAQWAGLCRAMREAAPRPSQERRQALQARLFARRSAPWLWAAPFAAAACLVLALALWSVWQPQTPPQAPLAAVNTPRQRPAPTTNHTVTPTPPESQPETLPGWLDEQWRLVFATRAELPEASPPLGGPRAGGGGTSGSASLLAPVLAQAPFRPLAWPGSPAGFALAGASVKRADTTGLGFDLVRLEYRRGEAILLVLQAADSDQAARTLAPPSHNNGAALLVRRDGVTALLASNARTSAQLEALAETLRPMAR